MNNTKISQKTSAYLQKEETLELLGHEITQLAGEHFLKDGQNIRTVAQNPWLLIPGLFVIVVVLGFNFLGDGLRDAADPYK